MTNTEAPRMCLNAVSLDVVDGDRKAQLKHPRDAHRDGPEQYRNPVQGQMTDGTPLVEMLRLPASLHETRSRASASCRFVSARRCDALLADPSYGMQNTLLPACLA